MEDLIAHARELQAAGLTPTDIVTRFREDQVPLNGELHEWVRADILKLLRGDADGIRAQQASVRKNRRGSTRPNPEMEAANKICPDCAESVKQGARICRYCRHEFAQVGDDSIAGSSGGRLARDAEESSAEVSDSNADDPPFAVGVAVLAGVAVVVVALVAYVMSDETQRLFVISLFQAFAPIAIIGMLVERSPAIALLVQKDPDLRKKEHSSFGVDYFVWFVLAPVWTLLLGIWPNAYAYSSPRIPWTEPMAEWAYEMPISFILHVWMFMAILSWIVQRPYSGHGLQAWRYIVVVAFVLLNLSYAA